MDKNLKIIYSIGILALVSLIILPLFSSSPSSTETLRPNAAGDETSINYQYPSSTFHWDKVDEETPDETSTYVYTNSKTYERDLYNLPASSGSGTINKITIYFRCKVSGGNPADALAKPALKSDGSVTDGTEIELTTSWTTYSQEWTTNPADSQPWEWDDIDNLQIGISLVFVDYTAQSTQIYVVVDYEAVDTCTCAGAGNDWEIDMSDYCNITDACDLTTGTLNFTGAGWCNCNASVDTTNLGDPGATGILYIQDSCLITID